MNNYLASTVVSKEGIADSAPDAPSSGDVWISTGQRRSSLARLSLSSGVLPAFLLYYTEDGSMQRFDLTRPLYTIGRKLDRDIVLQCPQISKDHCVLERDSKGYIITDRKSANGVLINGVQISKSKYLQDGDQIMLGTVLLEFYDEVEITPENQEELMRSHPAFAGFASSYPSATQDEDSVELPEITELSLSNGKIGGNIQDMSPPSPLDNKEFKKRVARRPLSTADKHLSLVTILPSDEKYDETITIRAELNAADMDFVAADTIQDSEVLKNDYEKLRLSYELSKLGFQNIDLLLDRTAELIMSVLPADRVVVMLVDKKTSMLTCKTVKFREGRHLENIEILMSSTTLKKVYQQKKCLITNDALSDPGLNSKASMAKLSIRSAMAVPLISNDRVHGILHIDSQDKVNAFAVKDLALVKAISNQTAIALENSKLVNDIKQEVSIRENLGRFLPPHVVERVIQKKEPVKKGGRKLHGTILFADIRGFTKLSEAQTPEEVVDMLNDFFERVVQIIFKYDGVLDKYIGDCVMAGFGTLPEQSANEELNAVMAATEFIEAVHQMNSERVRAGKQPITVGVGLNSGPLVAGYIGSSQRLEYTCIGDTVNTASRICSMANDNQVLISESTLKSVSSHVETRFVAAKLFKGKSQEVNVYEVLKKV
jgi:adenylate cyclase